MPSVAVVGVVEAETTEVGVVVIVGVVEHNPAASQMNPPPTPTDPNILIYHQGSGKGAICTKNTGGGLTFVPNPPPVHGKIFLHQDQIETVTSLATLL